jgi:hypothetical protein
MTNRLFVLEILLLQIFADMETFLYNLSKWNSCVVSLSPANTITSTFKLELLKTVDSNPKSQRQAEWIVQTLTVGLWMSRTDF